MQKFSIEGHAIGYGFPCFIIAEVAQAHDGSLGVLHSYIDAVAKTGVDANQIKLYSQRHAKNKIGQFSIGIWTSKTKKFLRLK